jgi:hypothetical protein
MVHVTDENDFEAIDARRRGDGSRFREDRELSDGRF